MARPYHTPVWHCVPYPGNTNRDESYIDRSVNTVVRTGCSHRLIDISRRDICSVPRLSDVSFLTGNGLLRGRNRRHVATDPRTMVAHHPYIKKVDDRLAERDRD